jgi:hypothetical protein
MHATLQRSSGAMNMSYTVDKADSVAQTTETPSETSYQEPKQ